MLKDNTINIAKLFNTTCKSIDFTGVSIDSRNCNNKLFIAIIGQNLDGHNFIDDAIKNGAKAIIASKKIKIKVPIIYVKDTATALTDIAHYHRLKSNAKFIAITGSNGKTTTKNMLYSIFSIVDSTLATKGNLNNHFGVPLTLLDLKPQHKFAIIEIGANHIGEIKSLRNIVNPDVAVVTNTLDAHIGEFGSFENLIKAKSEIYGENSKNIVNTKTIFNGDISFGSGGDIFANNIQNNQFELNIFQKKIEIKLQLVGKHNIENSLAAAACAYSLGIDINIIKKGLENTTAEKGRFNFIKGKNLTIIDDTYNASPSSMKIAINTLLSFKGQKIAIFGKMAELGNDSKKYHNQIGKIAKTNLDFVYSYGKEAKNYNVTHFNNLDELATHVIKNHPNAIILVKASRMEKFERIVKLLK